MTTKKFKEERTMSVTTHAPKKIDPFASLHAEALGQGKRHGRLAGHCTPVS